MQFIKIIKSKTNSIFISILILSLIILVKVSSWWNVKCNNLVLENISISNTKIIESEEFHLFATSGECNFSGAKICLQETSQLFRKHRDGEHDASIYDTLVEQGGLSSELYEREEEKRSEATHEVQALPWMWLLDAAKLASTSPLCLRELPRGGRPDFVTVSFYKKIYSLFKINGS